MNSARPQVRLKKSFETSQLASVVAVTSGSALRIFSQNFHTPWKPSTSFSTSISIYQRDSALDTYSIISLAMIVSLPRPSNYLTLRSELSFPPFIPHRWWTFTMNNPIPIASWRTWKYSKNCPDKIHLIHISKVFEIMFQCWQSPVEKKEDGSASLAPLNSHKVCSVTPS